MKSKYGFAREDICKNLKPESKIESWEYDKNVNVIDNICITEFKSINELINYIQNTPFNRTAMKEKVIYGENSLPGLAKVENGSGTNSFEEALELLKYGYEAGAEVLNKRLTVKDKANDIQFIKKNILDIVGYVPCVPNYLMNVPMNMINQKITPVKKKIITINKCIDYDRITTEKEIIESSVNAVRIIKTLEKNGYAVNVNIVDGYSNNNKINSKEIIKIRIKNSNERINLKKMAFPLIHPSMLRRIMFKYVDVSDTTDIRCINENDEKNYYTSIITTGIFNKTYKEMCKRNKEIWLDKFITENDIDRIEKL